MKKLLLLTVAAMMSASVFAQHEQIHLFQSKDFKSYKAEEVEKIEYVGQNGEFSQIVLTDTLGKITKVAMSEIDSVVLRSTGIPEFHVTLQDYPNWPELGQNGESKDVIHQATLYMEGNGMYDNVASQTVEFRGRGNSTWGMRKKPYRFKMAKKASVCGLPKAKTFALIANNIDCTLMRNTLALWLANYLEMPYSNHCVPVKVYFNGIYKGQYMLTEKIGIGGGSVDIDETTGMLFELDSNYDEDYKFTYSWRSGYNNKTLPVMVKDPDIAELAADTTVTNITNASSYFNLWKTDFTNMANAVTQRASTQSLSDVLDLESVVNFFMVNGIASNHEMQHPKSLYIHKKSLEEGEVYHFGPVWDFDWAFTFNGKEGASPKDYMVSNDGDQSGYTFLKALLSNEEIRTMFREKLDDFYYNGYPKMKEYMEEYANLIEPTAKENGQLWPSYTHASWCIVTSSWEFRKNFETLKNWIEERINFMRSDDHFGLYK